MLASLLRSSHTENAPFRQASNPSQPMVTKFDVERLDAWFGSFQAIKSLSMAIADRQVTSIIGPSGCGKSTFLRCLNRMHELVPDARATGSVLLDGQDVYASDVDPVMLRRRVGMVFQKPNPFPTMSIQQNVLAGLKLTKRLTASKRTEVVERGLNAAGLWDEVKDRLAAPATSLSGGQQQRLCIARTLAVEPDVVLMDEPCSALDPIATAKIELLIRELSEHYTIVIVTHNMQQATRISDYTAFMLSGELVEFADSKTLFTNPKHEQTENYITGRFG
jgi:phosphate transport system ATP-binding protein